MADDSEYDDRILLLLKNDDEQGASLLYHHHYKSVFHYAVRLIPDRDEAKDITQELFSTIWLKRHYLGISKPIRRYLIAALRNRVSNHRRNYARDIALLSEALTRSSTVSYPQLPDSTMQAKELEVLIRRAIQVLPGKIRLMFMMHRHHGMTYKEIAQHFGLSEKAIEKGMSKALALLRQILSNYL